MAVTKKNGQKAAPAKKQGEKKISSLREPFHFLINFNGSDPHNRYTFLCDLENLKVCDFTGFGLLVYSFDLSQAYYTLSVTQSNELIIREFLTAPAGGISQHLYAHKTSAGLIIDDNNETLNFIGTDDVEYVIVDPVAVNTHPGSGRQQLAPDDRGMIAHNSSCYDLKLMEITLHNNGNGLLVYSTQLPSHLVAYDIMV